MIVQTIKAALLLSTSIHVHAQTLYKVSVKPPTSATLAVIAESISIFADGVDADGATTYVEVGVESSFLVVAPTTTFTILSTPITFTETFAAGASVFRVSGAVPGGSLFETCTFSANTAGTCVEERPNATSIRTETFSGTAIPFYTLAAAATFSSAFSPGNVPVSSTRTNPIPTPTTSTSQNGGAPLSVSLRRVMAFFMMGILLRLI
ncbi:hypothetical protein C8R44DRAFT_812203 [Mycena epipterygia]|nr:hypothetical protein C8R44DRAFT_812203 [Mycena epipterygia]